MSPHMAPGPWYNNGVGIGVEEYDEDAIVIRIPASSRAIQQDDVYNMPVPSFVMEKWMVSSGVFPEDLQMGPYELVAEDDMDPFFVVDIIFSNAVHATMFKLAWG